jgi:hypothetical protein
MSGELKPGMQSAFAPLLARRMERETKAIVMKDFILLA